MLSTRLRLVKHQFQRAERREAGGTKTMELLRMVSATWNLEESDAVVHYVFECTSWDS